jgi:hypothetical protein
MALRRMHAVLMPIDVELYSISAGGVPEPRADGTAKALANLAQAIQERRKAARVGVVELTADEADEFAEQVGLHAAVAQAIALHQCGDPMWALPTKQGRLDWSFGGAMRPLRDASGARYALFVWVRDSYASPERVAMTIVIGLATGVVLIAPTLREPKGQTPLAYKSGMQAADIVALFERLYSRGGSTFTLEKVAQAAFVGGSGYRFEFSSIRRADDVRLRGVGWFAVRNDELWAITYVAPRLAFYPAGIGEAEAIARSARQGLSRAAALRPSAAGKARPPLPRWARSRRHRSPPRNPNGASATAAAR